MKLTADKIKKNFTRARGTSNIFCAVEETSLTLEPGKIVALAGPSGSGKSTLLNMMSGILAPSQGKVMLDDTDLYSMTDAQLSRVRNEHFGIIPQGQSALQALNVLENVLVPYTLYNKPHGEEFEKVKAYGISLLEQAGIGDLLDVYPSELSGGELRRMAVCRAMVLKPELIMADEPTGDLDEENTDIVLKLLKANAENGSAVLIVTHDQQVYGYADILLEMRKGTVSEMNPEKTQ